MSTRPQDSKQLGWEQAPSLSPLHRKGSCSSAFYNSLEPAPNLVDWFAWSVWLLWALKHLQRTSLVVQMVKGSAYNAGDLGSIPGWRRSPGEGNGNPLQYSCLENPMDWRPWQPTVHGIARVWHDLPTKPSHWFLALGSNKFKTSFFTLYRWELQNFCP